MMIPAACFHCRASNDEAIRIGASVGQFMSETCEPMEEPACKVGARVNHRPCRAQRPACCRTPNAAKCVVARILPGTDSIDESQAVVALDVRYARCSRDLVRQARGGLSSTRNGCSPAPRRSSAMRLVDLEKRGAWTQQRAAKSEACERAARVQPAAFECSKGTECCRRPNRRALPRRAALGLAAGLGPKRRTRSAARSRLHAMCGYAESGYRACAPDAVNRRAAAGAPHGQEGLPRHERGAPGRSRGAAEVRRRVCSAIVLSTLDEVLSRPPRGGCCCGTASSCSGS